MIRRLAAVLLATLALSPNADATQVTADFTDLWYIPSESGWGINMIQQDNTIFATLFVYGADNTPRWYVASGLTTQASAPTQVIFGGKLHSTTGPYFGAATFNPATVVATEVGTVSLVFDSPLTGVLVYTVNGVSVTKVISRQVWRPNPPTGQYTPAGLTALSSSCANPNNNIPLYLGESIGILKGTVDGAGTALSMTLTYQTNVGLTTCTFAGSFAQRGRNGVVTNGTWGCRAGTTQLNTGTFVLNNVDVQVNGMTAQFVGQDQFCTYNGRFGGLRDVVGN